MAVDGRRGSVRSADGTTIGFVTAGSGPPLLLVHGGMNSSLRWAPLWPLLIERFTVTSMDRRGRGMSGVGGAEYALEREYEDVSAVAATLADGGTRPVVFGHSIGAVAVLGAAALGAPFRHVVLYEPPGPPTVPADWIDRVTGYIAAGQTGRAMVSFLREVVGLSDETIAELRDTPGASDVLPIVAATMVREAHALAHVDVAALAARFAARPTADPTGPSAEVARVLLLLGTLSPPWAAEITRTVQQALPGSRLLELEGHGHEAVDTAPSTVTAILVQALDATGG